MLRYPSRVSNKGWVQANDKLLRNIKMVVHRRVSKAQSTLDDILKMQGKSSNRTNNSYRMRPMPRPAWSRPNAKKVPAVVPEGEWPELYIFRQSEEQEDNEARWSDRVRTASAVTAKKAKNSCCQSRYFSSSGNYLLKNSIARVFVCLCGRPFPYVSECVYVRRHDKDTYYHIRTLAVRRCVNVSERQRTPTWEVPQYVLTRLGSGTPSRTRNVAYTRPL